MKTFLFLLGLVAAGIVGYSFEPDLRRSLTGKIPETRNGKPPVIAATAADPAQGTAKPAPEIDPSSLSPDQLPKQVVLKTNVDISDAELQLTVTIAAGNPVDLIRIEGGNAIISPGSEKFQASVPISQTNLMEQLSATPPVEPEVAITPEPEPEPEPDPQPTPATPAASQGNPVDVMQSSIKGGDIKEFTFDQVLNWEASPEPETVDGETYQTGIASYKAETVFGVKTIQAKALIKGGKVVKWLWPKSGMEIK
jgi:hypothetical protein